jgi:MATE family multidrug resistance protein
VAGAALSTIAAQSVGLIIWSVLFLRESRREHAAGTWKLDLSLMRRLLRFGSPNGVQFMLDMSVWTLFLLLVGRLGVDALGASNLAFQVNSIAFFPVLGIAMATSTLVGQHLGANRPALANKAVWSSLHLGLMFTFVMAVLYFTIPGVFIAPFGAEADPVLFAPVSTLAVVILRFVGIYCLFDVGNLIFSSALKGAGDTLFVMLLSTSFSVVLMLLPVIFFCLRPGGLGVIGAWTFVTLLVIVLSGAFLLRYLRGHWQKMRVIEHEVI